MFAPSRSPTAILLLFFSPSVDMFPREFIIIIIIIIILTLGINVPDGGLKKIRENEKAGYV